MSAITTFGRMLAFSRLVLHTDSLDEIKAAVQSFNKQDKIPVVIESDFKVDLSALVDLLWENQISVLAVVDGVLSDEAKSLKMPILPNNGKRVAHLNPKNLDDQHIDPQGTDNQNLLDEHVDTPVNDDVVDNIAELHQSDGVIVQGIAQDIQPKPLGVNSFVQSQMVRSGQMVHHMGGDLIITNTVNQGAEVATDYNLHIYGKGQGRLVAGATGDENARIFCQKFDPSLVSVAGTYCLKEDIPADMINQAVEVSFSQELGLIFRRIDG